MVPMRDLDDDYYDFDERNYCLVGRRRHNRYQLGDPIRIMVAHANIEKRQLDFTIVGSNTPAKSRPDTAAPAAAAKGKKGKKGGRKKR